ncbi:DUF5710 domain-containing protein [Shewanella khirikhana]|uniref:DUF5710 domain-containing protein n=1 Tax=Shewanella khirikhana TaxID=1965282 RepID=UPI0030D54FDF
MAEPNIALVFQDPHSTFDDKSAAQGLRKTAEMEALLSSDDMKQRIAKQHMGIPDQGSPSKEIEQAQHYINVPNKEKVEAKRLWARWDREQQSWFVPPGVNVALFTKWPEMPAPAQTKQPQKRYLAVPYEERKKVKAAGAKWDKTATF